MRRGQPGQRDLLSYNRSRDKNLSKTGHIDGFFHAKPNSTISPMHELIFGSPDQEISGSKSSSWRTRHEWPQSYIGKNLSRPSEIIWTLEEIQRNDTWAERIAPVEWTNQMEFTLQQKIYSDDGADFIGISGPVTDVASYIQETTHSATYIGKGMTMHANMFSDPEGIREFYEKLLQISVAISKTEYFEFIKVIRRSKYSGKQTLKHWRIRTPQEYFDKKRLRWDAVRKVPHGIQKIVAEVEKIVQSYKGTVNNIIVPHIMATYIRFQDENLLNYLAGSKSGFPYNQDRLNSVVNGKKRLDFRGGKDAPNIKGMTLNVLRPLRSSTEDLYRDVLARHDSIGTWHTLGNVRDETFSNPESFRRDDYVAKIYDEDSDSMKLMDAVEALEYAPEYDRRTGKTLGIPMRQNSNTDDINFDPFLKYNEDDDDTNDDPLSRSSNQTEPIQLNGEMNVGSYTYNGNKGDETYSKWISKIQYSAKTMLNHLKTSGHILTGIDDNRFSEMFSYLERIPYSESNLKAFTNANWDVVVDDSRNRSQKSRFKDTYDTNDEPIYLMKQVANTGSYNIPVVLDRTSGKKVYNIPFGMSNYWGVQALSDCDPGRAKNNTERKIIEVAKRFVRIMRVHVEKMRKALPECQFLKEVAAFCPGIFTYPSASINYYLNTFCNASNFLNIEHKPFDGIALKTKIEDDVSLKEFVEHIRNNRESNDFKLSQSTRMLTISPNDEASEDEISVELFIEGNEGTDQDDESGILYLNQSNNDEFLEKLKDTGYISLTNVGTYNTKLKSKLGNTDVDLINLYRLFSELYNMNTNGNDYSVLGISGLFYNIFLVLQSNGGIDDEMKPVGNLENLINAIGPNDLKRKVRDEARRITGLFLVYVNARRIAMKLIAVGKTKVRTTLTLNRILKQSILSRIGGTSVIQQTKINNNNRITEMVDITEEMVDITEETFGNEGLYSDYVVDPYVAWYTRNIDLPMMRDKTLNYKTNIKGRCEQTYKNAVRGNRADSKFHRSTIMVLLLSDSNKMNVAGMLESGMCPIIEVTLFRPHMRYRLYPLIFIAGNGQAAFRVRGNPLFLMGMSAKRAVLYARYAQSMATIVLDAKNIYNFEQAMVFGYNGGSGTDYYDPNEYRNRETGRSNYYNPSQNIFGYHNRASIFVTVQPLGTFNYMKQDIDVSGHHWRLTQQGFKYDDIFTEEGPHFPTAARLNQLWNFTNNGMSENALVRSTTFSPVNTHCARGLTVYKGLDGRFNLSVKSASFWGDKYTKPGVKSYRNGELLSTSNHVLSMS